MDIHPYSGAQYATTNAPQAQAPAMPSKAIETMTSGMQAVNQHVHSFEDAIYDRVEYTVDQQHKLFLQQTQAQIEADFATALQAPDGSAGSLWNADGSFRNEQYNQFVGAKLALFNGLKNGYVRPESQEKAAAEINELKTKLKTNMDVRIAESIAPRAKAATLKLAEYLAQQGLYDSATAAVQGAPEYAMSPLDKEMAIKNIAQNSVLNSAKTAVITNDPAAYLRIVSNNDVMQSLTPEQRHKILGMQSQFVDTDPPPSRISRSGNSSPGKKEKKVANPLPLGVTDELITIHDAWLDDNGNYPKTGEARRQAIKAYNEYVARFVYPELTPEDALYLQSIGTSFGFSKEDANVFIEKNMAPFKMSKGKFDFNKALKDIPDTYFLTPQAANYLNGKRTAAARAQSALANADASNIESLTQARDTAAYNLEKAEASVKQYIAHKRGEVVDRFAEWLLSEDEKTLTDIDLRVKLFDIVDIVGDEAAAPGLDNPNDFSRSNEYRLLQEDYKAVISARNEGVATRKALEEETALVDHARKSKEIDADLHQTGHLTPSSFSVFANDANNLPNTYEEAYLAVPHGSPLAGETLAIQYNGRTRAIICRVADVSEPTLSANARLKMGLLNSNTAFTVAHDADGNAIMTAQSIKPQETNMYDIMLSNEARTDANGRPQIYKLPAGDGGGNFEVAGLNEKSNPVELEHVKLMLEANRPTAEIRDYIKSVYKQKTNYAAQLIPDSCSQGIELTIRDCALNHSPGGVSTIIKSAIGIPNTPEISTLKLKDEVAKFVRTHGEKAFLYNLSIARANYYRKLVVDKPERAKFLKGWLNRNKKVYTSSQSLLSTPR